ncbi:MAG: PAS domain S-box protein, partial [Gemmataceae bacterium]|nr:PAS domain S-box protein [Gemmataceae bacterium]
GERIPVRILWTPIPNSRGEISGYVATIRDNSEQKIIEGVIYEGQERFKLALENAGHGYWDWDIENNSLYLDERCKKIFGVPPEQIDFSYQYFKAIIHPEDYELVIKNLENREKLNESGFNLDYRVKTINGKWIWVNSRGRVIERDQNNNPLRVIGTIHDITERIEATEKLRFQEERFRKAFDYAPIGLALVSPEGNWLRVNKRICEIVGYSEEELLKIDFQTITHPEDLETDLNYVKQMLEGTIQTYQMEKRYFHKAGHIVHVLLAVSLVRDNLNQPLYFISQIKDITQRKMAEERLRQSLHEKETLLQEIHHRVKNNLAVIGSLFYLQSRYTDDPKILQLLQDCQDRVRSMALVHEQLYSSPDLSKINFSQYTRELVQSLHRNYNHSGHDIQLQLDLESVTLDVEKAIPCGLILNELITNAFKHAFPNHLSGHIRISLNQKETGEVTLSVVDSGIGIKPNIIENKKISLGMRLIHSLSKQIDGRVDFINHNPGTEVKLTMGA